MFFFGTCGCETFNLPAFSTFLIGADGEVAERMKGNAEGIYEDYRYIYIYVYLSLFLSLYIYRYAVVENTPHLGVFLLFADGAPNPNPGASSL